MAAAIQIKMSTELKIEKMNIFTFKIYYQQYINSINYISKHKILIIKNSNLKDFHIF